MNQTMTNLLYVLKYINMTNINSAKLGSKSQFNEIIYFGLILHNDVSTYLRFIMMLGIIITVYIIST